MGVLWPSLIIRIEKKSPEVRIQILSHAKNILILSLCKSKGSLRGILCETASSEVLCCYCFYYVSMRSIDRLGLLCSSLLSSYF